LAAANFRGRRAAGATRMGLGQVRVQQLDRAQLDRQQFVAAGDPEELVLQRDADRGQARSFPPRFARPPGAVAFTLDDVAYPNSSTGAEALAAVTSYPLTDASRI